MRVIRMNLANASSKIMCVVVCVIAVRLACLIIVFVCFFGWRFCAHCLQDLYELDVFVKPTGMQQHLHNKMDRDRGDTDAADLDIDDGDEAAAPAHSSSRTFSVQPKCNGKVHKLLDVQRYHNRWPKIPKHELFASSIQHPYVPEWRWLLHTNRTRRYSKGLLMATSKSRALPTTSVERLFSMV